MRLRRHGANSDQTLTIPEAVLDVLDWHDGPRHAHDLALGGMFARLLRRLHQTGALADGDVVTVLGGGFESVPDPEDVA